MKKINETNQIIISINPEKYLKKSAPIHGRFLSAVWIAGSFILIKGNYKKQTKSTMIKNNIDTIILCGRKM